MPRPSRPVKRAFREYLEERRPEAITEAVWHELRERLAPASERCLRELALDCGLPVEQPWAGVRQHTLEELEQSLHELLHVYKEALRAGDRERARYCRRQVIAGKDRAKFAIANPAVAEEKRELKREMAQWMLVWLENPPVFPAWVGRRKQALAEGQPQQ